VAEDLARRDAVAPSAESESLMPVDQRREERGVYRFRFGLAYLALAILAGAGIGTAVLLINRPADEAGPPWSNWKPTGSESSQVKQIADYVSGRYRLPSGNQLVAILAGPPRVTAGEEAVAVRAVAIPGEDAAEVVATDESVMYELCGLGARCAIREGRPSEERHQLLRREALELALYTFKYTDGANSVIAFLPPGPDAENGTALFFQKSDFRRELDQPLNRTLIRSNPPQAAELSSVEGSLIDRLTQARLFNYEFQPAPAGGAILVLAPLGG
jgi:hypothetical protein